MIRLFSNALRGIPSRGLRGMLATLAVLHAATAMAQTSTTQPSTEQPSTEAPAPAPAAPLTNAPKIEPPLAAPVQGGGLRGTYGAWSVVCDTPPGAKFEQCAMMQNVISKDRPDIGLSVVVLKAADGKSRILRVLAPLGVLLPNGLGLYVDNADKGRAYFVRCFTDGCYAEVVLEDPLIADLSKGKSAIFTLFQTPEEGIGIPVDLAEFAKAYEALP
jgi:invasion protein IalB